MQCLDLGSKDNMSVVLVVFADAKFGPKREKKAVVVDEKMDDQ